MKRGAVGGLQLEELVDVGLALFDFDDVAFFYYVLRRCKDEGRCYKGEEGESVFVHGDGGTCHEEARNIGNLE